MVLKHQTIAAAYIPKHKCKDNFLDYYTEFVKNNKVENNRHMECSLAQFKKFVGKSFVVPIDITENLCERFRKYLLDNYNGQTQANYFIRFKRL